MSPSRFPPGTRSGMTLFCVLVGFGAAFSHFGAFCGNLFLAIWGPLWVTAMVAVRTWALTRDLEEAWEELEAVCRLTGREP